MAHSTDQQHQLATVIRALIKASQRFDQHHPPPDSQTGMDGAKLVAEDPDRFRKRSHK